MKNICAVILAAGKGTRMKSNKPKVLHKVCGKTLLECVHDSIYNAGIQKCITVVGHEANKVKECMQQKTQFVLQQNQLGTGHAVMKAKSFIENHYKYVIVLNGDMPLITSKTIKELLDYHISNNYSATIVTTELQNPKGYGRIVRGTKNNVTKIVEHNDANSDELQIREINSGIYCFTVEHLLNSLNQIKNNNSQGEYYLTDTIEVLIANNFKVGALKIKDNRELLGINTRIQLAQVESIMRNNILEYHMNNGVTIIDPSNTYIGADVKIGLDTVVYPGSVIEGKTSIGEECVIGSDSNIVDSTIENFVKVNHSVILNSYISELTNIGPFAYLRPGSHIGKKVKIGDFVEIKNSTIGDATKVSHLTYIGDADVGKNVNMGCGSILVNYDGLEKHRSVIEDNAFVGCNVNLVSPVIVKKGAFVAAGSTITEPVPEESLAIARNRQTVKKGWVKIRNSKLKNNNKD